MTRGERSALLEGGLEEGEGMGWKKQWGGWGLASVKSVLNFSAASLPQPSCCLAKWPVGALDGHIQARAPEGGLQSHRQM